MGAALVGRGRAAPPRTRIEGDLAGVRDKDALARLADEERVQWERLWSDVDALLRRVSQPE